MTKKGSKGSHNQLVRMINHRLNNTVDESGEPFYDVINYEQEFKCRDCNDCLMEVDNYAIRQGRNGTVYVLLFEDKSGNTHEKKALYQLDRECKNIDLILNKHYIFNPEKVRVFELYVHNIRRPIIDLIINNYRGRNEIQK